MNEILAKLAGKECKIYISNNFDGFANCLEENKISNEILVISDNKVSSLHMDELIGRIKCESLHTYIMPGGEKSKSLDTIGEIYEKCILNKFGKYSSIAALGGGVVGDTAGFAACTYMRGIKFIKVPTTLIGCIDSSIDGKVGVDYKNIKDLIGTYYCPEFIYINTSTLKSLDKRQIISGIAEVIKYAVLFDESFFNYLSESMHGLLDLENDKLNHVIKKCIGYKLKAAGSDMNISKESQLLSFGHTLGHAIETVSHYTVLHGEAVAIGMMFECALSNSMGLLKEETMLKIFNLIRKAGLGGSTCPKNIEDLLDRIKQDKKTEKSSIRFIIPEDIGRASAVSNIKADKAAQAFKILENYWRYICR